MNERERALSTLHARRQTLRCARNSRDVVFLPCYDEGCTARAAHAVAVASRDGVCLVAWRSVPCRAAIPRGQEVARCAPLGMELHVCCAGYEDFDNTVRQHVKGWSACTGTVLHAQARESFIKHYSATCVVGCIVHAGGVLQISVPLAISLFLLADNGPIVL